MLDNGTRPRRRTALIDMELDEINLDITALQEVRFSGEGKLREATRTFYWKGPPPGEPRNAGVAFAIRNDLDSKLAEEPKGISERLMSLRIALAPNRHVTFINVYAPTMTYPDEEKEAFYEQLRSTIRGVPSGDKLILLGDFNARVGSNHETWGPVLGKFGRGQQNSNGELLTCLCSELDLSVTNTYFQQPDHHYFSWIHPRSKRPHLIDYVITRRSDLKDIKITRAMRGPDCHTDHYLIKCTLNFAIKPAYRRTRPMRKRRLDTAKLSDERCRERLQAGISTALSEDPDVDTSLDESWKSLSTTIFNTAAEVLGYTKRRNADWFNDHDREIKTLLMERNAALRAKLSNPNTGTRERLKRARGTLQRKLRDMEDKWWLEKAIEMQEDADTNNSAGFFKSHRLSKAVHFCPMMAPRP